MLNLQKLFRLQNEISGKVPNLFAADLWREKFIEIKYWYSQQNDCVAYRQKLVSIKNNRRKVTAEISCWGIQGFF